MSLTLDLQIATPDTGLPTAEDIQRWAELALVAGHQEAEVTIRLVDEEEIQALNRDYRGKDAPTNVLSFPFENPPGLTLPLLGDIIVCPSVVAREAREQDKPLKHHWAHMIIHGMLHLQGYDHILDDEAEVMENLERQLLTQLDIPDPYRQDR